MAAKTKTEEQKKSELEAKAKAAADKKAAKEIADKEKSEKKALEAKAKADASPEESNNDEVSDPEKDKDASLKPSKEKVNPVAKIEGVRVVSLVSMVNHDGTQMVPGELCTLSHKEHTRLLKDARGPFFKE